MHSLSSMKILLGLSAITTFGAMLGLVVGFSPLLPVVGAAGIFALFLLFRTPLMLLFALIVVRMSLDYSSQYVSLTLYQITLSLSQLLGVGIACLGFLIIILKRQYLTRYPLNAPFLLLFIWGGLTLSYSIAPGTTLSELLRVFDLFVLGFLAYATVRTADDFRHLLQAFFVSSILPIGFGLYQFFFHIGLADENVSILRIFGTFSHPNVYSLYLFALVVFGTLYLTLFARTMWQRLLILTLLSLFTLILLLTFARVAWIALFLFVFLIALFRYRLLLFPLFLFPFVLFVFSQSFQARVSESLQSDPDSSLLWRVTLWQDVTRYSVQEERALLGSGMDTFPRVSESLRGTSHGPNDPHNDFVKFFIEGGVVGVGVLVLYLSLIARLLIRGYRMSRAGSGLQIAFGIMLVFFLTLEASALTDNIFKNTPVQWLFFTALGALLALSEAKKKLN